MLAAFVVDVKFEKNGHITRANEKNWNEEIIYFVYTTEIKLPIIPLYLLYHLWSIPPYTTVASYGGTAHN
jgi:hypothetical protein